MDPEQSLTMLKRLLRSDPVQNVLTALLAGYMRLVRATTRWEVRGLQNVQPLWRQGQGVIGVFWHGRVLMTIAAWPEDGQRPAILISRSPDGAFIARATRRLGYAVIRGSARNVRKSKDKGGSAAFRQMIAHVQAGGCMALTPDGPRGPLMQASPGAVRLARLTGAPILCFAWSTRWRLVLPSWDRLVLPLPFGRGVMVWKGPLSVPPHASAEQMEKIRLLMQKTLREGTDEADTACGHERIGAKP